MRKSALLLLCLTLAGQAWAASQMKPGLWEVTMRSDAMKNMPKIPPEQMEQMRAMGMNVPQFQDGAMISKVCVTAEMAKQQTPGLDSAEIGCQTTNVKRSGTAYSADILCSGGEMKGEGKVTGTFSGNARFASTYTFKGTMHGQPINHRQESSGRWLAADCGSVKPVGK